MFRLWPESPCCRGLRAAWVMQLRPPDGSMATEQDRRDCTELSLNKGTMTGLDPVTDALHITFAHCDVPS